MIQFDIKDVRVKRNRINTTVMEIESDILRFPDGTRHRIEAQVRNIRQALQEIDSALKDATKQLYNKEVVQ